MPQTLPDFETLKPVEADGPDFATLKPLTRTATSQPDSALVMPSFEAPPGFTPPAPGEKSIYEEPTWFDKSVLPIGDHLLASGTALNPRLGRVAQAGTEPVVADTKNPVLQGISEGSREALNSLTTPRNIAYMLGSMGVASTGAAGRAFVSALWAGVMGKQSVGEAAQVGKDLGEEMAKPEGERDKKKIAQSLTRLGISAALTALPAAHLPKEISALSATAEAIKPVAPLTAAAVQQVAETSAKAPKAEEGAETPPTPEKLATEAPTAPSKPSVGTVQPETITKGEPDAGTIPSNQEKPVALGTQPEGIKADSGRDVQQTTSGAPDAPELPQAKETVAPGQPTSPPLRGWIKSNVDETMRTLPQSTLESIAKLASQRKTAKEIAQTLGMDEQTVRYARIGLKIPSQTIGGLAMQQPNPDFEQWLKQYEPPTSQIQGQSVDQPATGQTETVAAKPLSPQTPSAESGAESEVKTIAPQPSGEVPSVEELQAQRKKVSNLRKKLERQTKGRNAAFLPPPISGETRTFLYSEQAKLEAMESVLLQAQKDAKAQADDLATQFDNEQDAIVGKIQRGESVTQEELDKYFQPDSTWSQLAKDKGLVASGTPADLARGETPGRKTEAASAGGGAAIETPRPTANPAEKPLTEPVKPETVKSGAGAETITGQDEQIGSEMPAEREKRPSPRRTPLSTQRGRDLLDEVLEIGKISLDKTKGIQEDFKPTGILRKAFSKTGRGPDEILDALHRAGLYRKLVTEDDLIDALKAVGRERVRLRGKVAEQTRAGNELQVVQGKQTAQFKSKALEGERPADTKTPVETVRVNDLLEGETFNVQGYKFTVTELDFDEDGNLHALTVEDGPKFGVQRVGSDEVIHFDQGSLKTKPIEFVPQEKPELTLDKPESVEEQKARLAAEEDARQKKVQGAKVAEGAAKPLVGTTGDLGQGTLIGGPEDLFAPPSPKPVSSIDILKSAAQVRIVPPEGATQIRVTDSKGRTSVQSLVDLKKGNTFRGVDIAKIEAGTINRERKFQPLPGEVKVEPVDPPLKSMGGALLGELDQPNTIVSNMFAAIDRDRVAMGKPPMEATRKRSWDEDNTRALTRMNRDPEWIPNLIDEVLNHPRPLLSWENAGLVWQRAKWTAELNNALGRIATAFDGDQPDVLAESKVDAARFEDRLQELDLAVGRGGTGSEAGRTLQAQKMGAGDDFTLVEMRLRKRAAVGGRPLTDAESAEIASLHEQIAAAEKTYNDYVAQSDKRIADLEVKAALDRAALEAKQQPVVEPHVRVIADRVKDYFDKRADAALKRLSGKLFTLSPQVLADLTDLGVSRILSGAIEFSEWSVKMGEAVGDRIKPYLKTVWDSAQNALNERIDRIAGDRSDKVKRAVKGTDLNEQKEAVTERIAEKVNTGKRNEITMAVQRLAWLFVEQGVKEREPLIDAVWGVLKDIDPSFSRRDTMDAISGYGAFRQLTKDQISVELRDLKGQMQQTAKLEDMQAGKPPLKTGVERRIPSKEESRLIKLVNEAKQKFQIPITDPDTQLKSSLDTLKTRLSNRIDELTEKMASGDFAKRLRREIVLDAAGQRLKAEFQRTKQRFERMIIADRLRNRSWQEKAMDTFVKWRRGFVLSSPVTLGKLTTAAMQRMAFTPLEEIVGAGISKVIPGVARRAPREGGISVRAEAKALTQAFTQGAKDAWKTLKRGQSDLDVLHGGKLDVAVGEGLVLDRSIVDFIGQSHGMLKAPVKRAEFSRSLQKRIEHAIRGGVDPTDPLVMMRLSTEAYKDANRSIFLQDNAIVDIYKRAMSRLEQKEKATGEISLPKKATATVIRTLLPIVKVPTNIVAETLQYAAGSVTGGVRLGNALRKGVETLQPEQADLIMRELKKGSIGAALLVTGYLLPEYIGGYYQLGMKRKKGDVKPGAIRIGHTDLPYWMLHNPLLNVLQLGATIRRVADSKLRKKDSEPQGITPGVVAGGLGLAEETPFVREMLELSKAWNVHDRSAFAGELSKGILIPQAVQWLAKEQDVNAQGQPIERKPRTVKEHIAMGIPGLREDVPKKK